MPALTLAPEPAPAPAPAAAPAESDDSAVLRVGSDGALGIEVGDVSIEVDAGGSDGEEDEILLDEPMACMNVEEKEDMSRFILDVNEEFGTTVALIEHDMGVVMDIADRVVVMDYGKKIGDGTPVEIRKNQVVIDAYLGISHD